MADNDATTRRTQTSIVETVALIVVIIIIGWVFVRPQAAKVKIAKSQLQQEQSRYQNIENDKNDLNQLTAKLKQSQADINLIDEALPLQNRPTQLEVLLDSMVTAAGMITTDMSFRQENSESVVAGDKILLTDPYSANRKLATTTVDLNISGNIDQFRNFLQLLETNGRIIDVITMTVVNGTETTEFRVKLKAYSYVP